MTGIGIEGSGIGIVNPGIGIGIARSENDRMGIVKAEFTPTQIQMYITK